MVFGQSVRSRWDILLRGSVLNRFLSEVRDVTVQVVPMHKPLRKGLNELLPGVREQSDRGDPASDTRRLTL